MLPIYFVLKSSSTVGTLQQCQTHLYALRVDLLALLVPADPRLGVARRLAHEGDHAPRDANLVDWNFRESRRCWLGMREKVRDQIKVHV